MTAPMSAEEEPLWWLLAGSLALIAILTAVGFVLYLVTA